MSGNRSRGTEQERVGQASTAHSSLLISHFPDLTLMIWGHTCPLSYTCYPLSSIYFIVSFLTFFPTNFIHMETLLKDPTHTSAHVLPFNLSTLSHCIVTQTEKIPSTVLTYHYFKKNKIFQLFQRPQIYGDYMQTKLKKPHVANYLYR